MFALAGRVRGASERYRITAPVLQELRSVLDDPRNRSPDNTAGQENFARTLLFTAIGAVIEAADARPVRNSDVQGAHAEFGVPGGVLRDLARVLACERVGPYAPGNPRFQEVRVALFAAQGVPLPNNGSTDNTVAVSSGWRDIHPGHTMVHWTTRGTSILPKTSAQAT